MGIAKEESRPIDPARARRLIRWSWIAAVGGALWIPFFFAVEPTLRQGADPLAVILSLPLAAYAFWALFWGVVGLAKYWKRSARQFGWLAKRLEAIRERMDSRLVLFRAILVSLTRLAFLVEVLLYYTVLFAICYVYGLFGGAIYQYLRHRKAARLPVLAAA